MTLATATFAFECLLAVLLVVMIRYAWQMRTRIDALRRDGERMLNIIAEFDAASARAEASAAELRAAGADAERELGPVMERARAAIAELAGLAEAAETTRRSSRAVQTTTSTVSPSDWRTGLSG